MSCVSNQNRTDCESSYPSNDNFCRWRRGKVVANNTYLDTTSQLFETNICHPPTIDKWDEKAPACLISSDENSCDSSRCEWSTMQSYMLTFQQMNKTEVCLPSWVSLNASDYSNCFVQNASSCYGQCQNYDTSSYDLP
jgi:hypothetical protein